MVIDIVEQFDLFDIGQDAAKSISTPDRNPGDQLDIGDNGGGSKRKGLQVVFVPVIVNDGPHTGRNSPISPGSRQDNDHGDGLGPGIALRP